MFIQDFLRQRRICFLTAALLGSVIWMLSGMAAQASGEEAVVHMHTGNAAEGGGCYTRRNVHVHTGSGDIGGGCYTIPVYHSHIGSSDVGGGCYTAEIAHVHTGSVHAGGGCYTAPAYHRHTGSSEAGGGCYTVPVYHSHAGDSETGGGCYTVPVYHSHEGDELTGGGCYTKPVYHIHTGSEAAYANGCYTRKEEKIVATMCGTFADDGDGYWHCDRCGVRTPDWNVPHDRAHKPQSRQTVYVPGCGKSEDTPVSYLPECGKDGDTLEGYGTGCGKDESTVVSYQTGCGKNGGTVEGYALQCSRATDGYAPGCGKTEQTVERYETGCSVPDTYALGCGLREGEPLGSLSLTEREGCLYVEVEGITVKECLWSDGSRGNKLSDVKPGTDYSCRISYMDGAKKRSVELTIKTGKETGQLGQETMQPDQETTQSGSSGDSTGGGETGSGTGSGTGGDTDTDSGCEDTEEECGQISEEGTVKELLSGAQMSSAQIIKKGLSGEPDSERRENRGDAGGMPGEETSENEGVYGEGQMTLGKYVGPAALFHSPGFLKKAFAAACTVTVVSAVALGILLWSRCAILYCYDERDHYRPLGILRASRGKEGYRVRISGRSLDRGTSGRYRIAVNRWLRGSQEGNRFVVETDRQKLNLVLEEYVDFAL